MAMEAERPGIVIVSLINIRPSQGNRSMTIEDPGIRESVRRITFSLIGGGAAPMTQHAGLTAERWSRFSLDDQILMISNDMNRARSLQGRGDRERLLHAYERVLRLVDLTVEVQRKPALRRELLRWRDLVAEIYARGEPDPAGHDAAFRCLLLLTPRSARQIPLLGIAELTE